LPMNLEYSRCWRLGSWDRFIIPQPFSKVRVLISQPHHVDSSGTPEEFEIERVRVQDVMMSLVEMRQSHTAKRACAARTRRHGYGSSMAKLIDGRAVAGKVYAGLRIDIAELKANGVTPGLAVVLVGDDPASRAYVRSKDKMCRELGLHSVKLELPASTTQTELVARVEELNRDSTIHGVLVQSPPPEHIDEAAIVRALDPRKDVDGFHPENVAKLVLEDATGFVPCTPYGVQRLLLDSAIEINGAHVVVLGRSMIVGKPLALLLMQKNKNGNATVTVVHSRSRD